MINFLLGLILFVAAPEKEDSCFFEGRIDLVEKSYYDTTYYTYLIKDKKLRVNKFDHHYKLLQSILVNIENEQVVILSPSKKLFSYLDINPPRETYDKNFTVKKTYNSRQVEGKECYQWRVKNKNRNTEVAFWVSEENHFVCFPDFIKRINCTERTFSFFEIIPDTQGFFPMLTVERTLLRKEKKRIVITKINHQKIDNKTFEIPHDFEEVKN
ncbi:MAG TPA: DUF4412 domain-containing protein [Bacteroidales bacterium]|nr:DUF4412 domain-containing protein [Bacteroidales bacterium]